INLNCGCPSERVQRGSFGACLMAEPTLVADCVKAMRDAVHIPVTVKHRIGVDRHEDYGFVRDFVGALAGAGCDVFIVHARSAWLKGLSPRENRELPPLRYDVVRRLKADFPSLVFVLNGGLSTLEAAEAELAHVDGVMFGRAAYHDPWLLSQVDARLFGDDGPALTREMVVDRMSTYLRREVVRGTASRHIVRHVLGLYQGLRGARQWRRQLSDAMVLERDGPEVLTRAAKITAPPAALRAA
ncbi:MAG: tRNA dihydrouridine(20/20a) synthase DusA, partial [Burkholderiaceae bacterium]